MSMQGRPAAAPKAKLLGLIQADIRPEGTDSITDCETHHYGHWIRHLGIEGVETLDAHSLSEGQHQMDLIYATGSLERLLPAARELKAAGADALAFPCTCASFVGGLDWSRAQCVALGAATGLPATSTSLAMLEAVRALDTDTVDVLSAYPARVGYTFLRFLDEAGIATAAMVSLGCSDELASHALDLRAEVGRFDQALAPRRHPLLIPDTAINAIGLVAALEADIGRPVVAGNHATLWHALKLLGHEWRSDGAGILLRGPRHRIEAAAEG